MGKASRAKGCRRERQLVELLKSAGVEARRVPLSGATWMKGDVLAEVGPLNLRIEVKARANGEGFKTIEGWLADNDACALMRDRAAPMVVLPWETFRRLCALVRVASDLEVGGED